MSLPAIYGKESEMVVRRFDRELTKYESADQEATRVTSHITTSGP